MGEHVAEEQNREEQPCDLGHIFCFVLEKAEKLNMRERERERSQGKERVCIEVKEGLMLGIYL